MVVAVIERGNRRERTVAPWMKGCVEERRREDGVKRECVDRRKVDSMQRDAAWMGS